MQVIEQKKRYDGKLVNTNCLLRWQKHNEIALLHNIEEPFTMQGEGYALTIEIGYYTHAYYWLDKPYNLYVWYNANGQYVGAYFNIVGTTQFSDGLLQFEDKIIDVLVLPNNTYFVLDEDELPQPLDQFEAGSVLSALQEVIAIYNYKITEVREKTKPY